MLPSLWNRVPSESGYLSPIQKAISLNMKVKERSTNPVDPSNFLWALKRRLSSTTEGQFNFNSQQDVAEILQVVLDELKGVSVAAADMISNIQQTTISCNKCLCSAMSEETLDIIPLPVSSDIQTSLNLYLKPEILSSENKWYCPSCNALSESTRETRIMRSSPILIIQLCRFSNQRQNLFKNEDSFRCILEDPTKHLLVPIISDNDVYLNNTYSLEATINHSGSLNNGHYWANIKDRSSSHWLCCNDKLVSKVNESSLNNRTSYILFYRKL